MAGPSRAGGMAAASLWKWWIGSVLALALADYGAPRVGCARHVDVPFESVGNHPRLAILKVGLGRGREEKGLRSEEEELIEA